MARILIVDDHPVARLGLRHILGGKQHQLEEAGSVTDAMRALRRQRWDVMTLDLSLDGRSGIEVLKQAKQEQAGLAVLVVSMYAEEDFGVRALKAGASGYLTKDAAPECLGDAIELLLKGHKYISQKLADLLVGSLAHGDTAPHAQLTDREFEVLRMLANGMRVSDIARSLSLSVNTVSTHRVRVLKKLNLRHTAELTVYAVSHGLLDQDKH